METFHLKIHICFLGKIRLSGNLRFKFQLRNACPSLGRAGMLRSTVIPTPPYCLPDTHFTSLMYVSFLVTVGT